MRISIQLDDDVAQLYQVRLRPGQELEQVLQVQLARFASVDPHDRVLILSAEIRRQLEELTTRMPLTKAEDLVGRVAALAELSIGRIRFRWTPAQWRQLKEKAARWNVTPTIYAERIVREIEEQFFDQIPRDEQILIEAGKAKADGAA
jgi:hypothetical protein